MLELSTQVDFFGPLAYSANVGRALLFDFEAPAMFSRMLPFSGTVMTMTMPRVLRESRAGCCLAKVLMGQDRATNARFWRQVAVSRY